MIAAKNSDPSRHPRLSPDMVPRRGGSATAVAEPPRRGTMSGLSLGWRLGSEFFAAIIVGAGLGYLLDLVLPIGAWGLIVLLLLGFAAGVLNIARASKELNEAAAVPPGTPAVPDNDDD